MSKRSHLIFLACVWTIASLANLVFGGVKEMSAAFFIAGAVFYAASFLVEREA